MSKEKLIKSIENIIELLKNHRDDAPVMISVLLTTPINFTAVPIQTRQTGPRKETIYAVNAQSVTEIVRGFIPDKQLIKYPEAIPLLLKEILIAQVSALIQEFYKMIGEISYQSDDLQTFAEYILYALMEHFNIEPTVGN